MAYASPGGAQQLGTPKSIYEATSQRPQYKQTKKEALTNTINETKSVSRLQDHKGASLTDYDKSDSHSVGPASRLTQQMHQTQNFRSPSAVALPNSASASKISLKLSKSLGKNQLAMSTSTKTLTKNQSAAKDLSSGTTADKLLAANYNNSLARTMGKHQSVKMFDTSQQTVGKKALNSSNPVPTHKQIIHDTKKQTHKIKLQYGNPRMPV